MIDGEYIVILKSGLSSAHTDAHFSKVQHMVNESNLMHRYNMNEGQFQGYAVKQLSAKQASDISQLENVAYVEQNLEVFLKQTACTTFPSYSWGLSRSVTAGPIPHKPMNTSVDYRINGAQSGAGVEVVVMDSGTQCQHQEFATGRCTWGPVYTGESAVDGNGHGTHVASTIGGAYVGLARSVRITAVKICNNAGSCTVANMIAGVAYTASKRTPTNRVVGNMSVGGRGTSIALNDAIASASRQDCIIVAAAGNENENACDFVPANAAKSFTVGSTDAMDARSDFSNWGPCVDIFAPGSNIIGAHATSSSNTLYSEMSGTSMAAPHVSGMLAKLWSENPTSSADTIKSLLVRDANLGYITKVGVGSPNKLALVRC